MTASSGAKILGFCCKKKYETLYIDFRKNNINTYKNK